MKQKLLLGLLLVGLAMPFSRAEEGIDYLIFHKADGSNLHSLLLDDIDRILLTDNELVVEFNDNANSAVRYDDFSKITFGSKQSSIEEVIEESALTIAYLPADRAVSVVSTQPLVSVQVYNLQGRLVEQVAPQTTSVMVPLGDTPAGVYVVLARTGESVQTAKIIKY